MQALLLIFASVTGPYCVVSWTGNWVKAYIAEVGRNVSRICLSCAIMRYKMRDGLEWLCP